MPQIKIDLKKTAGTSADGRRINTEKGGVCIKRRSK